MKPTTKLRLFRSKDSKTYENGEYDAFFQQWFESESIEDSLEHGIDYPGGKWMPIPEVCE